MRYSDRKAHPRQRWLPTSDARGRRHAVTGRWVLTAATVAAGLLSSAAARHSAALALANVCILGGVVAAPVVSLVGWIGMLLPEHTPLHSAAPALFLAALIWLGLAFVSAHLRGAGRES